MDREQKLKEIVKRFEQMNARALIVSESINALTLEADELDKNLREGIVACFAHNQ